MNEEVRLVGNGEHEEDMWQYSLRPKFFNEYVGQEEAKGNLNVYIQAAKQRGEALDHVLLYGPPGLGKTTLAGIIANELGVNFRITSGPAIEKSGDLAAILTNLDDHDVLFIDEIHRLSRSVEEVLYSAMEDYAIDIIIGKGPSARTVRIDLPKFTLIGATTRAGALAAPLRDRFGIINRLEYYKQPELEFIVTRAAEILKIGIEPTGASEIARRSRGTPRIANRLLKRVRDFAQVIGDGVITQDIADDALQRLYIDKEGLDRIDRRVLECIIEKYDDAYPVWAFVEIITLGRFVDFYGFCAKRFADRDMMDNYYNLLTCKKIRNASAHNNCILNDLKARTSTNVTNASITTKLMTIQGMNMNFRKNRMSNARIQQIVILFYRNCSIGLRTCCADRKKT